MSRKELEILEKQQMFLHDNRNAILKARQEGRQEGRQKAEQSGRQQERLEIAKSLLDVLDVETIARKTGLAVADVRQLKQ